MRSAPTSRRRQRSSPGTWTRPSASARQNVASRTHEARRGFLLDNADWLASLNYIEFLRDVGRHFSVNRMLAAESVKLRLESEAGLSFLEFNYSIFQAYDFLVLSERYGCELQLGGGDQWGNITAGTDLIRRSRAGARTASRSRS
jgi:tyrosyl-tRNA synthetase